MNEVPDNYSRYELYEQEQARYERFLPKCDKCGEKCAGDYAYEIDNEILCEACFEEWVKDQRIDLEDYVAERDLDDREGW